MLEMSAMSALSAVQPDSHSIALSMVPESEATNLDPGKLFRICVELGALRSFAELLWLPAAQILFAFFERFEAGWNRWNLKLLE